MDVINVVKMNEGVSNYQMKSDRTNKWRMDYRSEEVKKCKQRIAPRMKERRRKTGVMEKRMDEGRANVEELLKLSKFQTSYKTQDKNR